MTDELWMFIDKISLAHRYSSFKDCLQFLEDPEMSESEIAAIKDECCKHKKFTNELFSIVREQ